MVVVAAATAEAASLAEAAGDAQAVVVTRGGVVAALDLARGRCVGAARLPRRRADEEQEGQDDEGGAAAAAAAAAAAVTLLPAAEPAAHAGAAPGTAAWRGPLAVAAVGLRLAVVVAS